MSAPLRFEPLQVEHLDELAKVLLHPAVYQHIEDGVPGLAQFKLGLERAIEGPGPSSAGEQWLNYLVRESSGAFVGRLEATVHHDLAEVAFLLGPQYWGRGWGGLSLQWLHEELTHGVGVVDFWATTIPANVRSRRLLERCGYVAAELPGIPLYSYEPGDLVLRRHAST